MYRNWGCGLPAEPVRSPTIRTDPGGGPPATTGMRPDSPDAVKTASKNRPPWRRCYSLPADVGRIHLGGAERGQNGGRRAASAAEWQDPPSW